MRVVGHGLRQGMSSTQQCVMRQRAAAVSACHPPNPTPAWPRTVCPLQGKFTWITESGTSERWVVANCGNFSVSVCEGHLSH